MKTSESGHKRSLQEVFTSQSSIHDVLGTNTVDEMGFMIGAYIRSFHGYDIVPGHPMSQIPP